MLPAVVMIKADDEASLETARGLSAEYHADPEGQDTPYDGVYEVWRVIYDPSEDGYADDK